MNRRTFFGRTAGVLAGVALLRKAGWPVTERQQPTRHAGAVLMRAPEGTDRYEIVGELLDITSPHISREMIEYDEGDGFISYHPGAQHLSDVTVRTHGPGRNLPALMERSNYKISMPDGVEFEFAAFCTTLGVARAETLLTLRPHGAMEVRS